jgi:hypothetical protein
VDALFLIGKLVGFGAIFVVTVGVVGRTLGAGYGRRGKLPPRAVEVLSVVAGLTVVFLVALVWLRWF